MRYSKFWIYIVAAIVAAMTTACDSTTQAENGHDYDWEIMRSTTFRHSPECRKCKEIRKAEIKQYVDSVLQAKGLWK